MDEQIQNPRDDKANEPQRQWRPVTREAVEQLDQIREKIMKERNGKPFEDSTEIIRQMREERTEELMRRSRPYDKEEESTSTDQPAADEANQIQRQHRPATRKMSEEFRQLREEIMRDRNGKPFEDSVEMLRREREKRTEYLMWVATGQHGKDPYEEDNEEDASQEQL